MTTKTDNKQSPIIGKLTKYRNALRFQAGASLGSSLPVTELSSSGPLSRKIKIRSDFSTLLSEYFVKWSGRLQKLWRR